MVPDNDFPELPLLAVLNVEHVKAHNAFGEIEARPPTTTCFTQHQPPSWSRYLNSSEITPGMSDFSSRPSKENSGLVRLASPSDSAC